MTMNTYFWAAFEEPAICGDKPPAVKTQTRAREEVDQRVFHAPRRAKSNMATKTSTREQSDQHQASLLLAAIPPVRAAKTMTATREEKDPVRHNLAALPQSVNGGTQTMTEAREQSDQDKSIRGIHAIPRFTGGRP
jgi:hypothetical protein